MGVSPASAPWFPFYPPILSFNFHIESLASHFVFNSIIGCNAVL